MTLTRHRFRLAIGLLICIGGLALFFSPGRLFPRLVDGAALLLVGCILCFVREFHLRFSRDWFTLGLGLILAVLGIVFTLAAVSVLFGSRAHGLLPFYELIGIGPLMLTTGVLIGFDKKKAG